MASRLSELLDRIRPAGAPGAPTDAEPRREFAASEETARLVRLLECLESEADDVIAAADRDAATIRAEARQAADAVRSARAERVAVASAEVRDVRDRDADAASAAVDADAEARIAELRAAVDLDAVADRVVDVVWRTVEEAAS